MPTGPVILQPRLLLVKPQYDVDPDTGDVFENVLWFQSATAGTPTVANLATMASHFDTQWGSIFSYGGATGKHYNGSIWTDYQSTTGLSYTSVGTFTPAVGTSGSPMPPNTAILISMSNGERFRGGHFRTYLPWLGTSAISTTDPSNTTSGIQSAITTAFANLNGVTTGSGVLGGQSQVLYRHRHDAALAQLYPIVSFQVRLRFATQRRRLRKAPHH